MIYFHTYFWSNNFGYEKFNFLGDLRCARISKNERRRRIFQNVRKKLVNQSFYVIKYKMLLLTILS